MLNCIRVQDISSLTELKQLKELNLAGCNLIEDLNPLTSLRQLTSLNLRDYGQIHIYKRLTKRELDGLLKFDLKPLKNLTRLSKLIMSNYGRIHLHQPEESIDPAMITALRKLG